MSVWSAFKFWEPSGTGEDRQSKFDTVWPLQVLSIGRGLVTRMVISLNFGTASLTSEQPNQLNKNTLKFCLQMAKLEIGDCENTVLAAGLN